MPMTVILADATTGHLVGWWMALAFAVPFVPWAWLVSSKLDKDAKYFHLNHRMWNGIHMAAGVAALLAMMLVPVPGLSWAIGVLLLLSPVLVYWRVRNQAVPEQHRYSLTGQSLADRMAARKQARASRQSLIKFAGPKGEAHAAPMREDPAYAVHMLGEDILGPALEARASRVEMAVGPNGCAVTQTIDGFRFKREAVATDAAIALIDYLKRIAGLDVEDRRRKQTGRMFLTGPAGRVEIDLTTAGSSSGQVLRLELDRRKRLNIAFNDLGLLPSQADALKGLLEAHDRHGIMLIGAPPGHGLTSSCYGFLSRHDAYTANIKTLEMEVLRRIDGIDHVQFDPTNPDVDYATNLQSILRRDPDVVLTAPIQDRETARVAVEPGMQGPLLYVPQPLGSIVEQIRQWVKVVGDVKDATRVLRAATNQRLMRKLCPNCRQAYQPSPEQIKKLNLPPERAKQLFRASGKVQVKNKIENCPVCAGTGYLGQTAAFEVFVIDDEARKLLGGGDLKGALAHARRNKMVYLQEAALAKVIAGETTIDEVIRVTSPQKAEPVAAA